MAWSRRRAGHNEFRCSGADTDGKIRISVSALALAGSSAMAPICISGTDCAAVDMVLGWATHLAYEIIARRRTDAGHWQSRHRVRRAADRVRTARDDAAQNGDRHVRRDARGLPAFSQSRASAGTERLDALR